MSPSWSSAALLTARPSAAVAVSKSGPNSSRMSSTLSTSFAPSRISWWQPFDIRQSIAPGTAKTSRPCSVARRAVIRAPDRSAACTTTTPSDSPDTIRFRCGNVPTVGAVSGGSSLIRAPESMTSRANSACSGG